MNQVHKSDWISYLDYFFVLRPMLFFPGWSTLLAGYFVSVSADRFVLNRSLEPLGQGTLLVLILSFASVMGSSFILNQLQDVVSDRQNNKLFIISGGLLQRKYLLIETVLLTVLALILGGMVSLTVCLLILTFFIVTGIFYNFPPFTMKDRPWSSLLANMLMGGQAFAIGFSAAGGLRGGLFRTLLPYLFFNTALYLFTTLPDLKGDLLANKKTLAVIYGKTRLIHMACLLYLAGCICAFIWLDIQALVFYLLSLPFFILTYLGDSVSNTLRTTKYGILFFAFSIGLQWPAYFLLMVSVFCATRFYYRRRFNFNYPNFSGT
jgi:4-hydroxybenzoate polyprenyltransferase